MVEGRDSRGRFAKGNAPWNKRTKLVCAKCKADWISTTNPARCPACEQVSFGIVVPAPRDPEGTINE